MKIVNYVLVVLFGVQLTSCATVMSPKSEKVTIVTGNSEAKVTLDGVEIGTGDSINSVIHKRKNGTDASASHSVKVEIPGHKTSYQTITPSRRMAAFWPLQAPGVVVFFIPTILDLGGRLPFVFDNVQNLQPSYKLAERDSTQMFVEFGGITWNDTLLENKYSLYEGKLKNTVSEEFYQSLETAGDRKSPWYRDYLDFNRLLNSYPENEHISDYLLEGGFVDTVSKVFRDVNQTVELVADVRRISSFKTRVKGFSDQYCVKVEVMWYLYNQYGDKLDSIQDVSYSGEGNSYWHNLVYDALENSFVKVTYGREFFDKTQRVSSFEPDFAQMELTKPKQLVQNAKDAFDASVTIKTKNGFGSGFAITNDGYILTNYHVVASVNEEEDSVVVFHPNGKEYKASLVRVNRYRDLALLKIDESFTKAFGVNQNKQAELYQKVYTIGCPKSIELKQSFNQGIVSGLRHKFETDYIQLQMSVNGGNSGGPLFDKNGELTGVIVSKLIGFNTESIGFAIPGNKIPNYLKLSFM